MNKQTLLNRFSRYLVLLKYLNCALATFATLQRVRGDRDDDLLRAVNGLEGGCAACGLTCGIATGGSLGVGMANEDLLSRGLKGEVCGAFTGAVLGINLAGGSDIRSFGFPGNLGRFVRGHISLVRKADRKKKEVFARGKQLALEFRNRFGSMRCSELCGVSFGNSAEFISHITGSALCGEIMDFAADQAVQILNVN